MRMVFDLCSLLIMIRDSLSFYLRWWDRTTYFYRIQAIIKLVWISLGICKPSWVNITWVTAHLMRQSWLRHRYILTGMNQRKRLWINQLIYTVRKYWKKCLSYSPSLHLFVAFFYPYWLLKPRDRIPFTSKSASILAINHCIPPAARNGKTLDNKALGQYSMCSEDKLILARMGMNILLNLLKGLMGPLNKPHVNPSFSVT